MKRRQKYIVCTDEARANKHMLEKSRYAASKTADMLQEYKRLIKQLKKEYKSEVKADSTKEELTRTTNKLKNVTAALKASDLKLGRIGDEPPCGLMRWIANSGLRSR